MEGLKLLEQGHEGQEGDLETMARVLLQALVTCSLGCLSTGDPRAPSMESQCGWESPGELRAAVLRGAGGLCLPRGSPESPEALGRAGQSSKGSLF